MTWAVTVERDGEKVVTIETNCLSGREISAEDTQAIRTAAHHLLAFIGEPVRSDLQNCYDADRTAKYWSDLSKAPLAN